MEPQPTYQVYVETSVLEAMHRIPRPDRERIAAKIGGLRGEPRPSGCEKLDGMRDAFRLRQGDYRIVYEVDDAKRRVAVTRVAHRSNVYRRR
jgi:mRNA interferase RelE/StbE